MDRLLAPAIAATSLLVLSLLLFGCAASPGARARQLERHSRQAVVELEKKADADSLAAAGLLLRGDRERSLALVIKATEAAPLRADLVWLEAQVCQEVATCNPEPTERRLRRLDSANGAGWLGALIRASGSNDFVARDDALAAISHSDRVDVYWTTLIARLSRAAARTGAMTLQEAQVAVIGSLAGRGIPAYSAASNACKGGRLRRSEVVETCRGVAKAFERGDIFITEMIGVAIAKRVWPENSPGWKAAAEARRVYEYRSRLRRTLDTGRWDSPVAAARFLALCEQDRREQDVLLTQLIEAGADPNPPSE